MSSATQVSSLATRHPECHPERRLRSNRVEVLRNEAKRNEAKPTSLCKAQTRKGSARDFLDVCSVFELFLIQWFTRMKAAHADYNRMQLLQAACQKPFADPAVRFRASRSRFCSASCPLADTSLCKTSTHSRCALIRSG